MEVIGNLKKLKGSNNKVTTDNWVFRLHYKYSTCILVALGLLATSTQYFGTKIECSSTSKTVRQEFINQYCYIHPTYVVATTEKINATESEFGQIMPHYGVVNSKLNANDKRYYNYYQWVSIVLFIQAMFLYVPRMLWKECEGPMSVNLNLDVQIHKLDDSQRRTKCARIIEYLTSKPIICQNSQYYRLIMIEVLNLLVIVCQFVYMSYFLDMDFRKYGWKVLSFDDWSYEHYFDPMTKVFPKMTKCRFIDYGSSGGLNRIDYLCILPLNVINEKIYLFLWFWFQFLIVCNVINLIYRCLIAFSHELRYKLIVKRAQIVDKKALSSIVNRISIGEWYILGVLSQSFDEMTFDEIFTGICDVVIERRTKLSDEISV